MKTPGVYTTTVSCSNRPNNLNGVCIVIKRNAVVIQKYYSGENPTRIYYRAFENTWGEWKRNYDESILTDSTVLSPLASALGGIAPLASDLNSIPNGVFVTNAGTLNNPVSANMVGFQISGGATGRRQLLLRGRDGLIYYRWADGNNWGSWYQFQGTLVQQ